MKTKAIVAVASLVALGLATVPSFAAPDGGYGGDPNSNQNVQPGPLEDRPADPSTADDAASRVPTTRDEFKIKREGEGRGTSGKTDDNPMLKDGPME